MSDCADLIGLRYRLGADGSNGEIDCIHLVYVVLERLGIPTPTFKESWYQASAREIMRDLLRWGVRVEGQTYDGDVIVLHGPDKVFAVSWQNGILYISRETNRVNWCVAMERSTYRCFRMRSS